MKNLFLPLATMLIAALISSGCTVSGEKTSTSQPTKIIFETDMGNDVDDALALDMLYKYQEAGLIDLLLVSSNKTDSCAVEFIKLMNDFYNHSNIPVATMPFDSLPPLDNHPTYVEKTMRSGKFKAIEGVPTYNSVNKYREILASQPDSSVVIVSVGFSTNLKWLLQSQPDSYSQLSGKDLVAQKVKFLSVMAGSFNGSNRGEFNVIIDIPSAQYVFENWPTDAIVSPWETGAQVFFKAEDLAKITYAEPHPMKVGYEAYLPMPYDRECWDETSVIAAIEGVDKWFSCSSRGDITVNDKGVTTFSPNQDGLYRIITVDSIQAKNVADYITSLVLQTPQAWQSTD